jgi:hypothetical protein
MEIETGFWKGERTRSEKARAADHKSQESLEFAEPGHDNDRKKHRTEIARDG